MIRSFLCLAVLALISQVGATTQQMAESECNDLGWTISYHDLQGGALVCYNQAVAGAGSNCNDCDSWRLYVWEDGAVDQSPGSDGDSYSTLAGKYYGGHVPCEPGNTLQLCGDTVGGLDCNGVMNGGAEVDDCGVCGGNNDSCEPASWCATGVYQSEVGKPCIFPYPGGYDGTECISPGSYGGYGWCATEMNAAGTSYAEWDGCQPCYDCEGTYLGDVVEDECGVCGGDSTSCIDCFGVLNGGAVEDQCGVCGGDDSSCTDCDGVVNGGNMDCHVWCAIGTYQSEVGKPCKWYGSYTGEECISPGSYGGYGWCATELNEAGTSYLEWDGCKPCFDCAGEFQGEAVVDQCGVCGGDDSTCTDCAGTLNGSAEVDECGVCNGDNSSCADCAGVPNGDAVVDDCGVCDGDNACVGKWCATGVYQSEVMKPCQWPYSTYTGEECVSPGSYGGYGWCATELNEAGSYTEWDGCRPCYDCHGVYGGEAVEDECGVCDGDGTSCIDCFGVLNGGAVEDQCGVCGGDDSSCTDCDGVVNGGNMDCHVWCAIGTYQSEVGKPCVFPYPGGYDGTECISPGSYGGYGWCATEMNEAGTSYAEWDGCKPCFDCDGVFQGDAVVDQCGVCRGDDSSCTDCAGTLNGSAQLDECGVCNGDGSTCEVDCEGVAGGDAREDYCGVCNGDNSSCTGGNKWCTQYGDVCSWPMVYAGVTYTGEDLCAQPESYGPSGWCAMSTSETYAYIGNWGYCNLCSDFDPTTEAPTTEAPTTEAPTTEAPTTEAPTTEAPTTEAPTTEAPTTEEPTTTEAPECSDFNGDKKGCKKSDLDCTWQKVISECTAGDWEPVCEDYDGKENKKPCKKLGCQWNKKSNTCTTPPQCEWMWSEVAELKQKDGKTKHKKLATIEDCVALAISEGAQGVEYEPNNSKKICLVYDTVGKVVEGTSGDDDLVIWGYGCIFPQD